MRVFPFLVLQRNDHSLYVRILLFLPKSSMTCFTSNLFFFKFLIEVISIIMVRVEQIEGLTLKHLQRL